MLQNDHYIKALQGDPTYLKAHSKRPYSATCCMERKKVLSTRHAAPADGLMASLRRPPPLDRQAGGQMGWWMEGRADRQV